MKNIYYGSGQGQIRLTIELPWAKDAYAYNIALNVEQLRALAPLALDHDLSFYFEARLRGMRDREKRDQVIYAIVQQLGNALAKAIASHDPVNGYTPQEIEKMHHTEGAHDQE